LENTRGLIMAGQYKRAMDMDIANIKRLFPHGKYNKAIKQMKAWAKCMKYI